MFVCKLVVKKGSFGMKFWNVRKRACQKKSQRDSYAGKELVKERVREESVRQGKR